MSGWLIAGVALSYTILLFGVAFAGDRFGIVKHSAYFRPFIYSLSIAVYCTSWTFFGSVGLSAARGLEFLAIYTGPILAFTIGIPIIRRMVELGKAENLTSIADLLAARYGKSMQVAWLATIIATIGTIPYIALQLKAIVSSIQLLTSNAYPIGANESLSQAISPSASLLIAVILALFAMFFGTRHADATEHQEGLVLAIALESIVKLFAFLAIGIAVVFFVYDGPADLFQQASNASATQDALSYSTGIGTWVILTLLSGCAVIMLPRQFHMAIVENRNVDDLATARWMFPLYLILINLFVFPIALAGLLTFGSDVSADLYVLALPIFHQSDFLTIAVFVGGLSAATAMVIVACVALSIMISNDIIIPLLLRRSRRQTGRYEGDWASLILNVRRTLIFCVMAAAFIYYRAANQNAQLASIGLLAFAAIAQLGPALIFGLYWRRANARGALLGLSIGCTMWIYTLLLPSFSAQGTEWIISGPFGIDFLKPQNLFGFQAEPLNHGVVWSLLLNSLGVVFGSLSRQSRPIERVQASAFIPSSFGAVKRAGILNHPISNSELLNTISLYLGPKRARRAFENFHRERGADYLGDRIADAATLRFAEQNLSGAVGSATARLIMTLLLEREGTRSPTTLKLLDDASTAIQENRDLLQIALDQIDQGILVLDQSFRLRCWNQQYRDIFQLSEDFGHVGISIFDIHSAIGDHQNLSPVDADTLLVSLTSAVDAIRFSLPQQKRTIEVTSAEMPGGGLVITLADVTDSVEADAALIEANEELETRVVSRTKELSALALALEEARNNAEQANTNKTKFLAATGHDILQPLNAARLYCSTGMDQSTTEAHSQTLRKIDSALDAVEDIITTVLDISRLDTDRIKTQPRDISLDILLSRIIDDSQALAKERGIELRYVATSLWVRCDQSLLRRLVQNLVTNALNYTETGKVLVGVRRKGAKNLMLIVADTGIGISLKDQKNIFTEFARLHKSPSKVSGLGLGLSIVQRASKLINGIVTVRSIEGRGSQFQLQLARHKPPKSALLKATNQQKGSAFGLSGLRVLCVDNEPAILDGIKQLLTNWGCEVMAISSSAEFARLANPDRFTPDVLIVDYQLDNETGFDVSTLIQKVFGQDLPTYMATADRTPPVAIEAANRDISIIHKPLKPAALRAVLSKHRPMRTAAE